MAGPTKKLWIALGTTAAVAVAGGVAGFQKLTGGTFPDGVHPVAVYTVDDQLTTSGSGGSHLFGMCDADSYHIEVDSAEQCVVLDGSLGTVKAAGTREGIVLDEAAVKAVQGMVRQSDGDGPDRATRVLLQYEGSPVAILSTTSLRTGQPVTATTLD